MREQSWINVAKLAAILAVLVDHTYGVLYTNQSIEYSSFFSVSLFIYLMGITCYWSYDAAKIPIRRKMGRKMLDIFLPYCMATFIFNVMENKTFDFESYITHMIHFNQAGPFYYVLLYMQLVLISPIVFYYIKWFKTQKHSGFYFFAGLLTVGGISALTTNCTNILSVLGGGGKLFGGNYLILFYMGMFLGAYYEKIDAHGKWLNPFGMIVSLIAAVACWRFICVDQFQLDSYLHMGGGLNPPSISLSGYSFAIMVFLYFTGCCVNMCKNAIVKNIYNNIGKLGKHTLYIFLYHCFFLNFGIWPQMIPNTWLWRLGCLVTMIVGSLFIEKVLRFLYRKIEVCYKYGSA